MEKALFSTTCTTCQARLGVRHESAIGAILECPKCGSFVQIVPPEGWTAPPPEPAASQVPKPRASGSKPPLVRKRAPAERPVAPILVDEPVASPTTGALPARGVPAVAASAAALSAPPPSVAPVPAGAETSAPAAAAVPVGAMLWQKWLLLAGAPLLGLIVIVGAWSVFFPHSEPESSETATLEEPEDAAPDEQPAPADTEPKSAPAPFDRRWLPDRAAMVFSYRPSQAPEQSRWFGSVGRGDEVWEKTVAAVLRCLGLKSETVRRLTWVSTDLAIWPERSVVILELEQGQNAGALSTVGEAADFSLAGVACRRLRDPAWPHPLAVIDATTIVTGHEALLRHLASRSEVRLESATLERLWKVMPPEADVTLMVDLSAARKANWKLPTTLFDIWPAGKRPWHLAWEMPEGLGCALRCSDRLRGELALVCDGDTAAEKVHVALKELVPAAADAITAQMAAMPEKLKAGRMTAAVAGRYGLLLEQVLAALKAARWELSEGIVWMRVDWGESPSAIAALALDSRGAVRSDWLSAARSADEEVYRERLLKGLLGYQKAEGRFPPGAEGGALLPPETRLSWIAKMLPYFDHADWHRKLEFAYPWNGPQNRGVTGRLLPEVVNPAVGPEQTEAGFYVTHYVGVAGLGADAGRLGPDDPRAGMFGYGRSASPEEITRGASNTIAVLGVTGRVGPWASGGEPTIRPLTQAPYVNGPDGFGSGQPDGMLAGMADGSVRFISKNVDPRVIEQLATVRGGGTVTAQALDPKPAAVGPQLPAKKPALAPDDRPLDEVLVTPEPAEKSEKAVAREEAIRVDVDARLADAIPAIELTDVPLGRAIGLLSSMSTVPITVDPEALADLEVTLSDPVTVKLSRSTVGKVLAAVASGRGLACAVENAQVLVTSPAQHREALVARPYTVSDLTGVDAAATGELAALVERLVVPDSWRSSGGRGTIKAEGGTLVVTQTEAVHRRTIAFCEKLRTARGKPLRSHLDPDRFTLATRHDRARETLGRGVTANFHQPAALAEIVALLEETTQADILLDYSGLHAAGKSGKMKTTLKVEKQPLSAALDGLFQPLGLAYRVVDGDTLQVTTRKAVDARLELEFYPVAALLKKGLTEATLLERIRSRVAAGTWNDAGGPGVLCFDKPSGCLIVLQSQPVQIAVQRLLAEMKP